MIPNLTEDQKNVLDFAYSLTAVNPNVIHFSYIITTIVVQNSLNILSMLRRTSALGPSIIMMVSLRTDLSKFFTAFLIPLVMFVLVGYYMNKSFTEDELNLWGVTQAMFSAFNGEQDFGAFQAWQG